jgi:hypothetical protein
VAGRADFAMGDKSSEGKEKDYCLMSASADEPVLFATVALN